MTLTIGSLCSGYGGLERGVQAVYGGTTAWVSDVDRGACKILAHRFPGVPNIGDMTTVDWAAVEPVDLLTAGYPCQPFSHAGNRKGTNDARHLWPVVREAVRVLRPRLTVLENVAGHRSLGFDRVLGDLAEDGMHVRWASVRASDVGSCHKRERLFILVTPDAPVYQGRVEHGDGGAVAHDQGQRRGEGRAESARLVRGPEAALGRLLPTPVADNSRGLPSSGTDYASLANAVCTLPTPTARDWKNVGDPDKTAGRMADRGQPLGEVVVNALLPTPLNSDAGPRGGTTGFGLRDTTRALALLPTPLVGSSSPAAHGQISGQDREQMAQELQNWGQYAAAIARWEALTRPAPPPTEPSAKGTPRLSARFSEWMMGLPDGWVTDVPGITRNEALKALGNGVVPQQCEAALRIMDAWGTP